MVALLKQKSKVTIQHKPRTKYAVKNIFKRPKPISKELQVQREAMDKALGFSGTGKTAVKTSTGESQ